MAEVAGTLRGWMQATLFTIWRCPDCGARGWAMEPHGHIPSSHATIDGTTCHGIPETRAVEVKGG